MQQNTYYNCNLCLMKLRTKRERDKHMILRHGSINETLNNKSTMLQCIVELSRRVDYLETKLIEIQNGGSSIILPRPTITVEEYLETCDKKEKDYKTWLQDLEIQDDDLQYLFDTSREECILQILIKQPQNIPLLCLNEKPNIIYKFEENTWNVFETEEFKSLILILSQRILRKYIQWKKDNHDIIVNNGEMSELNIHYMNKVNGGSKKFDSCVKEIKKAFIEQSKKSIYR